MNGRGGPDEIPDSAASANDGFFRVIFFQLGLVSLSILIFPITVIFSYPSTSPTPRRSNVPSTTRLEESSIFTFASTSYKSLVVSRDPFFSVTEPEASLGSSQ